MPRIFDNIDASLLPALQQTMELSDRADFCVGYFNLRGWKQLDHLVEKWPGGEGNQCRLLVGMQRLPQDELREVLSVAPQRDDLDNQTAIHLKKKLAEEFKQQLTFGVPTNDDEAGLRRLAAQLKAGKLVVKLFLKHTLHAKLYLLFRPDPINPIVGYLGSVLVRKGVEHAVAEEKTVGGQLGRPSGARFRTYERLKRHAEQVKGTLFDIPQLAKAIEEIYRYPLRQSATDTLNRQLRAGISDEKLGELVIALRHDDRLCLIHEDEQTQEPQLICSLGLAPATP